MVNELTFSASCILERKSAVPDLAMVPRLLTRSWRVMPMPESMMCSSRFSGSALMRMLRSGFVSSTSRSVSDRSRILSSASDPLEINSRRKIWDKSRNKLSFSLFLHSWFSHKCSRHTKKAKAYLLVPVERVDDELHHAVDFGLEGEVLRALLDLAQLRHAQPVRGDGFLLTQHCLRV